MHRPSGISAIAIGLIATLIGLFSTEISRAGDLDFGSALIVGVGGAYAATPDAAGAVWLNPAMIVVGRGRGCFDIGYRRLFELEALGELHAAARHRISKSTALGAGFARFGEAGLYQETQGVLAIARRVTRNTYAGLGVRYLRIEFGNNDVSFTGALLDLGAAVRPAENWLAAAAVRSVKLDGLYADSDDDRGLEFESSVAWSAPPDIIIAGIVSHESDSDTRFGIGQRLRVTPEAEFLSGLRFDPVRYSLGGRIAHRRGAIEYVYLSHPELGGTHTIGASWHW